MVNLALYSDQIIPENLAIDIRLLELMKAKTAGTRIAYVPSGPEPDRRFFHDRKSYYAQYDLDLIWVYDLNELPSPQQTADLFGCSGIHLSGGHTAGFLQRLRSSGMLDPLRSWALQGRILIGTSAGAILMTPTIAVDALFSDKRPEEVTDGDALDLLPFEFFPHLNANAGYLTKLMTYSRHTERPIVAVNDGEGVVVTGELIECIGNPIWILRGAIKQATAIEFAGMKVLQKS